MVEDDVETEDPGERAHELYWSSDRSVNSIAEELGLSKGGLYQHILPLPAEGVCPRCGGSVGYFNRTARDRNEPTCIALCDNEESFPVGGSAYSPPRRSPTSGGSRDDLTSRSSAREDSLDPDADFGGDTHFADEEDFLEEVAFEMEGGFAGVAGFAASETDEDDAPQGSTPPPPPLFEKLRTPLSESERLMVAGVLLAAATGILLLRLSRR